LVSWLGDSWTVGKWKDEKLEAGDH